MLVSISLTLTSTGDPSVCETQCARLSEEFGFHHISLEHILVEKSKEPSYRYARFLKDCLRDEVDIPVDLVISLLESKIEEAMEDRGWSLVCGFPKSIDQHLELERKVNMIPIKKNAANSDRSKNQIIHYFSVTLPWGTLRTSEARGHLIERLMVQVSAKLGVQTSEII